MPASALDRFLALRAHMEESRKWYQNRHISDRLAAVLAPGDARPQAAVTAMNTASETLRTRLGLFSPLRASIVRQFTAALLTARGMEAGAFLPAYYAARARLREAELPRGGYGEVFAILLHYLGADGQTLSAAEARGFRESWRTLKSAHWWIAGAQHYPFLVLGLRRDSPRRSAEKAVAVYAAIRARNLSGGPLRLAAALSLAPLQQGPEEIAARYRAMHDAFKAEGLPTGGKSYGSMASLCQLEGDPAAHAGAVAGLTRDLRTLRPRLAAPEGVAVMLLLADRAQTLSGGARAVAEALAIIAAQEAAMAATAAVTAAAAAGS